MEKKSSSSHNFCFTLFNLTEERVNFLKNFGFKYLYYGHEVCPETGKEHLQGYFIHPNKVTPLFLKKTILKDMHIEIMRGSFTANATYCAKEGGVSYEDGVKPVDATHPKRRWHDIMQLTKDNKLEAIADQHPDVYFRYERSIKRIRDEFSVVPDDLPVLENYWLHGSSGTHKSRTARQRYPLAYRKNVNKWWDNYAQQEVVIIDEWELNHEVLSHHLKIWADHYPFLGETKGGGMMMRPKIIVVTSNWSIDECFGNDRTREAIKRRFKEVDFDTVNDFKI